MKHLLATTAIALLAAGQIAAQEQAPAATDGAAATFAPPSIGAGTLFVPAQEATDFLSSDLVGLDVYSSQAEYDPVNPVTLDARAAWDDIGEVDDLLISATGQVRAALVDVGGFLGLGTHTVALDMNALSVLTDETGARFVAVNSSKEALEQAPAFEPLPAPAADVSAEATPEAAGPAPVDTMAADAPSRDAFVPLAAAELTADRLEGAAVYSQQDESIGDIAELIIDPNGKITEAIVDVGGFLGIGEHRVAVAFDEINVVNDPASGDVRVYIDATREDLEQHPEYQG